MEFDVNENEMLYNFNKILLTFHDMFFDIETR